MMASNSAYNNKTMGTEVAQAYSSRANGRIVLITGVSPGGIGDATARAFAHGGASTVIITGRSNDKLSAIVESLSEQFPSTKFRSIKFDFDSLKQVGQAANEILDDSTIPHIDILVGNAGRSTWSDRTVTEDGIETHFGVNHIGHFHFVTLLFPKLRAAAKKNSRGATRIIMISSAAQISSPIRFSDWNFDGKPLAESEKPNLMIFQVMGISPANGEDGYDPNIAYGQSKTANTLFAVNLNKILYNDGIYAFSLHPGVVTSTGAQELFQKLPQSVLDKVKQFGEAKTIDQGAATTLVAALDPGLKPEAGAFLEDCQIKDAPAHAVNPEAAEKLWKLSEDIVKEKIGA